MLGSSGSGIRRAKNEVRAIRDEIERRVGELPL